MGSCPVLPVQLGCKFALELSGVSKAEVNNQDGPGGFTQVWLSQISQAGAAKKGTKGKQTPPCSFLGAFLSSSTFLGASQLFQSSALLSQLRSRMDFMQLNSCFQQEAGFLGRKMGVFSKSLRKKKVFFQQDEDFGKKKKGFSSKRHIFWEEKKCFSAT